MERHPDCSFRNRLLVGENPPPIKKTSSHKDNRANTAYRSPNPTRNFKKLAHYLPPLVCYSCLAGSRHLHLWYTCAEGFLVTSSQLGQTSFRSSWIISSPRISFTRPVVCAWLSRLSLDHVRFFPFDLINSIGSPGQAAPREVGDRIERETRF
jgi:hypothetical protein